MTPYTPLAKFYYEQAVHVVKGPIPGAEPVIAEDPYFALMYAVVVLNDRFPAGEPTITKEPIFRDAYLKHFPQAKWDWAANGLIDWTDV